MREVKIKGVWRSRNFILTDTNVRIFTPDSNFSISTVDVENIYETMRDLNLLDDLKRKYK